MTAVAIAAAPAWTPPRFALRAWRDLDLTVDLGDRVGAPVWWRGLLTLLLLATALVHFAGTVTPLPVSAPARPADRTLALAPLALGGEGAARVPASPLAVRLAEPPERPRVPATARLGAGGMTEALAAAGVGRAEAEAVAALTAPELAAPLKPGTTFDMILGRRETKRVPRPLESLVFRAAFDLKLAVARDASGGLALTRIPVAVDRSPLVISARVGRALGRATRTSGVPAHLAREFARALGYRLDLERDVRGDDRFTLVIAHQRAETGETIVGDLLYARLDRAKGDPLELLRWGPGGSKPQFFLADGWSAKRGLMRTPVEGARMTSGFGLRLHPILGYSRFHRGVDFGAPMGAPIVAAAGGTVAFAGWHGGHGKYVRVAHTGGLASAYGHMSRIAVRPGQAVAQGQVIGWVGSTGMSTGPHLHYEVWRGGQAIDPRGAKLMSGLQVPGAEMGRFKAELARLRGLHDTPTLAAAASGDDPAG